LLTRARQIVGSNVEVDQIAILLVEAAVVVVSRTESDGEVREHLKLILGVDTDLSRAVIAIAGALEVGGTSGVKGSPGEELLA